MNSENQDNPYGDSQMPPEVAVDDSAIVLAESADSFASASPPRPQPLGVADYLSWAVVILVTLFITVEIAMEQFGEHEPREAMVSDLMQINLQSQVLVGQRVLEERLLKEQQKVGQDAADESPVEPAVASDDATAEEIPVTETKAHLSTEPVALDTGIYEQRLCYAILLSELYGPQRAVDYFETLDEKVADVKFEPNET